jgi:UDP-N-acetylmuramyl tripeptide synthase
VLNRDDERIAALAAQTRAEVSYYGVAPALRELFPNDEELYGGPVHVSSLTAAVELQALPGAGRTATTVRVDGADHDVVLRAEGPHNAQNACGAAAVALSVGLDVPTVLAGLAKVSPAFGRGQAFAFDGRRVVLQLVKNPAGFRQTLHTLDGAPPDAIVIAINDDYADGRDVSWLWDVDFTGLAAVPARRSTAGTRAADMAVRLRYDDVEVVEIEANLEKAVRAAVTAVRSDGRVVVFSTYTAMWALHAVLVRIGVPA